MSHRRKSACCCDGKQGPCFLGYGTVPKTDYMREYIPGVRNRCAEGSDIESGFPEEPECQKNYHDNWAFCDPTKEEELVLFIERPEYNFSTTCAPQTPSPCVECDPPPECADVGQGFQEEDDDQGGGQGGGDDADDGPGQNDCCDPSANSCPGAVSCDDGCDIEPYTVSITAREMKPIVVRYRHPTAAGDQVVNELAAPLPSHAKDALYQWSFKSANNLSEAPFGGPPPWSGDLYPLNGTGRGGELGGDRERQIDDWGTGYDHGLPAFSQYNGSAYTSECRTSYDCLCSQGYFWACHRDPEYENGNQSYPFKFHGSTGKPSTYGVANIIGDTWRTSDFGWVKGADHNAKCYCCGENHPDAPCNNCGKTKAKLGPGELGGSYFWLQDIADSPRDHWYANFRPTFSNFVFDSGNGPLGTSRLAETLLCVVHREKYYERYYTSILNNSDPRGYEDSPEGERGANFDEYEEYFPSLTEYNGEDNPPGHWWGTGANAWISKRTPKYFMLGCAGVPIFTWEIAFNDTLKNTDWRDLDYGTSLDEALLRIGPPGGSGWSGTSCADLLLLMLNGWPIRGKIGNSNDVLNFGSGGYLSPRMAEILQEEGILPDPQNYGPEQDFKIFKKKMMRINTDWDGDYGMCCLQGPITNENCLEVHPEGGCDIPSCGGTQIDNDSELELIGTVCNPFNEFGDVRCCGDLDTAYVLEFDDDDNSPQFKEWTGNGDPPSQGGDGGFGETPKPQNEGDWFRGTGWAELCVGIAEALVGTIESPGLCSRELAYCLEGIVEDQCLWASGQWHGPVGDGPPPMCEIEGVGGYCIGTDTQKAGKLKGSCCKRCQEGFPIDCVDRPDCCDGRESLNCRCADTTYEVGRDGLFSLAETCGGIDVGDADGDLSEHGTSTSGNYKWSANRNCWNNSGFETCGPAGSAPGDFGARCERRGPAEETDLDVPIIIEDRYFYGRPGGWAHQCKMSVPSENYGFNQADRYVDPITREPCFTAAPIPQYTSCVDSSPCDSCGDLDAYVSCMTGHCCDPGVLCIRCANSNDDSACTSQNISETCRGAWFAWQVTSLAGNPEDGASHYDCTLSNNAWLLRVDPWLQFDSTKGPDAPEEDQVEIWQNRPGWIPTRHYDDDPHFLDDEISWYHHPLTITPEAACGSEFFPNSTTTFNACCGAQCTAARSDFWAPNGILVTGRGDHKYVPSCPDFNCKKSDGAGVADPACGRLCEEGYYCCPYTGQCMPWDPPLVDPEEPLPGAGTPCYPCPTCPEGFNCCVEQVGSPQQPKEAICTEEPCTQYDTLLQLPQENIEWRGVAIPGQTVRVIPGIVGGSAPYTVSYTFKVNDVVTSVVEGDGAGAEYEITLDDITDLVDDLDVHATFTELRTLINATPDGGILDLAGQKYGATPSDFAKITISNNMTITNGTITGSMSLDWVPSGSNRLRGSRVDAITANYNDPTAWLIDEEASSYPVLAVWPTPAPQSAKYPLTYNGNTWMALRGINDNNGPTDMGDVNTDQGDNIPGGIITGFTITSNRFKDTMNDLFTSLDTTVDNLSIFMHAGPNVVGYAKIQSWDESTGVCVFVPGSNNSRLQHASSDYFHFILMGDSSFITGNGQYVIDEANELVLYQPAGGSGRKSRLALSTELIRTAPENTITFNNLTLTGNRGGEFWLVAQANNPDKIGHITMTNCDISFGCAGLTSYATVQDSTFRHMQYRGVAGFDGMIIERCLFEDIVNKSAIAILCRSSADTANIPVDLSIIRDCKISMPSAVHGQGISLYNSSWQNSIIEHNIFLNCDRSLSFQPEGTVGNRRTTPGVMIYQNNLSVLNQNFYDQAGGQQGIAYNGADDQHIIGTQSVIFRSNTILGNPDIMFGTPESRVRFGIEIRKLKNSMTKIENNLMGSINAVRSIDSLQPHQHANNFHTFSADLLFGQSYPSTDTINVTGSGVNQDVWINYSTLQLIGAATTGASDGRAVGIRWNSIPTLTQLLAADKTWATTYTAANVPVASTTEDAWFQNIAPDDDVIEF